MHNQNTTEKEQVAVILQARTGSKRFPRKVLAKIGDSNLVGIIVERIKNSKLIDDIILATTLDSNDDILQYIGESLGIKVCRGSNEDVLSRFVKASTQTDANIFVRITCDCPLIDPEMIDDMLTIFLAEDIDYMSNCFPATYPDGLDIEIFTRDSLMQASEECCDQKLREHVTPWMRSSESMRRKHYNNHSDWSKLRWTIDEPIDLEVIRLIFDHFNNRINIGWEEVYKLYIEKPDIFSLNMGIKRNEGFTDTQGQKLWARANRVIPGGNSLLSKKPDLFLPDKWPPYFHKATGCKIEDIDGDIYIDMSTMGVGTNILGYSNTSVDNEVRRIIELGNMSSLNCQEEVLLAEKLVELHPWSDMARFARTGGEANAMAIRIARAATGYEKVAICGYHGWHDWYLASNLDDSSKLEEHLLPGLEPIGVPKALSGLTLPFSYNNLQQLEDIIKCHKLAAVKMEVQRSNPPNPGFLEGVRKLCDTHKIVLIFDECTSGFRETLGGLHKKYNVDPDMAIFGKALGNGYAITSVIGRKEIMSESKNSFISSTFWTERIGPTAALKTLEVMKSEESWNTITTTGKIIKSGWQKLAEANNLSIVIQGLDALASFYFDINHMAKYKSYITQEMLKKGFLASTTIYTSIAHTETVVDSYLNALNDIFSIIGSCKGTNKIDTLLEGPPCQADSSD